MRAPCNSAPGYRLQAVIQPQLFGVVVEDGALHRQVPVIRYLFKLKAQDQNKGNLQLPPAANYFPLLKVYPDSFYLTSRSYIYKANQSPLTFTGNKPKLLIL